MSAVTVAQMIRSTSVASMPRFSSNVFDRLRPHVRCGLRGVFEDSALLDSRAGTNPFVVGVDHLFQIRIGQVRHRASILLRQVMAARIVLLRLVVNSRQR